MVFSVVGSVKKGREVHNSTKYYVHTIVEVRGDCATRRKKERKCRKMKMNRSMFKNVSIRAANAELNIIDLSETRKSAKMKNRIGISSFQLSTLRREK